MVDLRASLAHPWQRWLGRQRGPGRWLPPLLVVAYLLVLLVLRPATPFEWDEVQYQRALDRYDVAAHCPHPPGAPLFVAAGVVLRSLLGDPQLAIQVAAMLFSCLGLVALYRFVRCLGGARWSAVAAAAICALAPCFLFHANVGLTDAPAAAMLLAAGLFASLAFTRPRYLPVAAVTAALASGIRPQAAPVLVPFGLALLVIALRRRWWRPLAIASCAFVVTFAVVWLPAILITGVADFRAAVVHHATYLATVESNTHFPNVELRKVLSFWLVGPLGRKELAAPFWLLAASGLIGWWRAGRGLVATLAAAGAALYVVQGFYTLNVLATGRFFLPVLPWVALLVAGNLMWPRPWPRRLAGTAIAAWCVASVAWGASTYLQRLEPAPVWAALTHVRDHYDPATTRVLYDGAFRPHVDYLLVRAGFTVEQLASEDAIAPGDREERVVVLVRAKPIPGRPVLLRARWQAEKMLQLAFHRYDEATVMAVGEAGPWLSTDWQEQDSGAWSLWKSGTIRLADGEAPLAAAVCPENMAVEVQEGAQLPWQVERGACREVELLPGEHERIRVRTLVAAPALFRPFAFAPLTPARAAAARARQVAAAGGLPGELAYIVPVVARRAGVGGSQWVTEWSASAGGGASGQLVVAFLPSGSDNSVVRFVRVPLAGSRPAASDDLLTALGFVAPGQEASGALVLLWDGDGRDGLELRLRTVDRTRGKPVGDEGLVPVVRPFQGLRPGDGASFPEVVVGAGSRVTIGAVGLAEAPLELVFEAAGQAPVVLTVPVFGHAQRSFRMAGGALALRVQLRGDDPAALAFPYLTVVEGGSGRSTCLVATAAARATGEVSLPAGSELGKVP